MGHPVEYQKMYNLFVVSHTNELLMTFDRYTIMYETPENKLETSHGYFKLDPDHQTELNLTQSYILEHVKWIYFTAISPKNPQRRSWFHAIRGPAFGKPTFHGK